MFVARSFDCASERDGFAVGLPARLAAAIGSRNLNSCRLELSQCRVAESNSDAARDHRGTR